VRLPRVVAGASLIVALAMVVVPGSAGSRTPSAPAQLDPARLQPVEARAAQGGATTATRLDPAHRSDGALDTSDPVLEPAQTFEAPTRAAVNPPAPAAGVIPIATPRPTPRPTPKPLPATGGSSSGGSSGGTSSGSWNYDSNVSWYGPGFYGNRTACGQTLTTSLMGVAHRTLACGTRVSFRNPSNGKVITVPVVDRGPYAAGRNWDLTGAACTALSHCYTGPLQWRYP
jgi:hypothetical protein